MKNLLNTVKASALLLVLIPLVSLAQAQLPTGGVLDADGGAFGQLLANILGGGTGLGNRLTMNLRETHGWTYSPYSYFTANSFSGHHLAAADVTNTATDSAVVEMIAEMGRLASEPIDAKELEINVKSAVGSYVMSLARPDATARRVQSIDFHHMPSDYYDRLVSTYNTTTAKDLADLAAKYYRKNDMVIVVVGKASQIKEGLERIGNVEVWDENFEKIESEGAASLSVTADEVWANMLDAMGGKENLRAINSLSARGQGTLSFSGQTFPAAYILLSSKPNNMYQEISATVPGAGLIKIMQQFVTADGASMMQAGRPMPLSDGAIDTMVAASRFLGEAYVEEQGAELTLQSAVKLDGRRYYVVVFAVPGIGERTYYIDAESWLPARIDTDEGQSHQSDWIAVDGGIMRPTKFGVAGEGGSWEFTDIVYDVNLEIPASKFDSGS